MLRRAAVTITAKCALAFLLLAFAVMSVGVSMPCLTGMGMKAEAPAPVSQSCCPEKTPAPVPEKPGCCCVDTVGKTIAEFNVGKAVQPSIDFPILPAPEIVFQISTIEPEVQQVRWPEVHGPPGIEHRTASPRAPPAA
jgi:hypothetical protein